MRDPDFKGWATKNDLLCSDGRTIRHGAFAANDGKKVPLVWNHQHNEVYNVLGHAILHNADNGVRVDGYFNDTESGTNAKMLVHSGDIAALSIWANQLKQNDKKDVLHGDIKEVSLVLAGANPGASIDTIIQHSETSDEEALVYTGEPLEFEHSDDVDDSIEHAAKKDPTKPEDQTPPADTKPADQTPPADAKPSKEESVLDVFNTLSDKQKTVVYAMIGKAVNKTQAPDKSLAQSEIQNDEIEGENTMKHNVFDKETGLTTTEELSHSELLAAVQDGKKFGSMKEAFMQHGITNIDYLFPDAQTVNQTPGFIKRDTTWVESVMGKVHHTPFSRIKSVFANITADDARAKGYIKGKQKLDEVFSLLKRTTTPQTVYKHQSIDRDDVVDITDFDVIAWLKTEMRFMLDEELARAFLVGDGRLNSSDDKIKEDCIRPIWKDDDLYTIKKLVTLASTTTADQKSKLFIQAAVKSRKDYKGSGNCTLFTTEDVLTDCLLMEDNTGRIIYDSVEKLATALRVVSIITVPVMEGLTRVDSDSKTRTLMGIIVNLTDYNVGADKGGAVNMFDDFDIDYNKQKYLIETRCSAALVVPYSAIAIESIVTA